MLRPGGRLLVAKQRRRTTKRKPVRRKKGGLTQSSNRPRCRIVILGVGGAGNRIVSRLANTGGLEAECVAVNTDLKDLNTVDAMRKVLIGEKVTRGLSARGNPEVGRAAAHESMALIESLVENVDVAFVVVGLGGGTGTGAAPVVAETARRKGAVVVGVVATPFKSEGCRAGFVTEALSAMQVACDTVVVVDNNKIMKAVPQLPIGEVSKLADQILTDMIENIVDTVSAPSLVNLDITDFKTVVREGGVATVGMGESDAPNRAEEAVRNAMNAPLLNVDYTGVTGALIHVSGDPNMTVHEVDQVKEFVTDSLGQSAKVVWGAKVDPSNEGILKVTLVMTGINSPYVHYGLCNMMTELYDLESAYSESARPLQTDLGLDQIEDFED